MSDTIRTLQAIGFSSTFFAAGYSFSASQLILPQLYGQPISVSTPIFRQIFSQGALVAAPSAIIASLAHGYLAYVGTTTQQSEVPSTSMHAAAALTALATLAWTRLVMFQGIEKLNGIADSKVEQEKADRSEVERLLRNWTVQNYVRCLLWVTAGVIGVAATFN